MPSAAQIPVLNLEADVVELTRDICDIESVSGNEKQLADADLRFELLDGVLTSKTVLHEV